VVFLGCFMPCFDLKWHGHTFKFFIGGNILLFKLVNDYYCIFYLLYWCTIKWNWPWILLMQKSQIKQLTRHSLWWGKLLWFSEFSIFYITVSFKSLVRYSKSTSLSPYSWMRRFFLICFPFQCAMWLIVQHTSQLLLFLYFAILLSIKYLKWSIA
jgi:hypothetical protein